MAVSPGSEERTRVGGPSRDPVPDTQAERFRTEQPDKHRGGLLADGEGSVVPAGLYYRSAQAPIGTVEGQFQTWHRDQGRLSGHSGGWTLEDQLAGLPLKNRREVIHDHNSTP